MSIMRKAPKGRGGGVLSSVRAEEDWQARGAGELLHAFSDLCARWRPLAAHKYLCAKFLAHN